MTENDPEDSGAPSGDAESAEREIARAAGDHRRMAIDNDTGIARPSYDQYAVNDPDSIDKLAQERAREAEISACEQDGREKDSGQEGGPEAA